jgi:hypothetical protein
MLARVSEGSSEPPASSQQSAPGYTSPGLQHVAAFSAVLSCCQFACGLFNFLVSVVMTNVSRAVGAKAWHQVGPRVWLAIVSAVFCGVLVAGVLIAARHKIFDLLALSPELLSLASPLFTVYAWSIPGIFLSRVATGVLGGFNRLTVLCALNVSGAVVEVAGVALALSLYSQPGTSQVERASGRGRDMGAGSHGRQGLSGVGSDAIQGGALQAVGCAITLATSLRALVGICLIPLMAPPEARGRFNFSPWRALARDESEQVGGSTMRAPLLLDGTGKRPVGSSALVCDGQVRVLDAEGVSDGGGGEGMGGGRPLPAAPPFHPLQFLRDSANMMVRSLCLQLSLWAMCISCSRLDPSGALLAAHHVSLQIWSLYQQFRRTPPPLPFFTWTRFHHTAILATPLPRSSPTPLSSHSGTPMRLPERVPGRRFPSLGLTQGSLCGMASPDRTCLSPAPFPTTRAPRTPP